MKKERAAPGGMNKSPTGTSIDPELTQARSADVHGVTYFIRAGDAIKIGSAAHFKRRLHALQTAHEKPLEVLAVVPASLADEFRTHQLFAHLRIRGEWFRADQELLHFIEGVKAHTISLPEPEMKPKMDKAIAPKPSTSYGDLIQGLHKLRAAHGADTPMGHACSNVAEIIPALADYVRPEWATHESQTLPWLLNQQLRRIEAIKAAQN